jgi:hypothetical protein
MAKFCLSNWTTRSTPLCGKKNSALISQVDFLNYTEAGKLDARQVCLECRKHLLAIVKKEWELKDKKKLTIK